MAAAVPGTPELTAADAGAWLDGFMPNAIRQGDIAGAVVFLAVALLASFFLGRTATRDAE